MNIADQMNYISGKKSSFCWITVEIGGEYFMSDGHDLEWAEGILCVVDDGNDGIDNVGTIFEVIGIE